ncbi:hypothetical protein X975_04446, partial [Stegodyphus mimosarum]
MLIEAPFLSLEKIIIPRKGEKEDVPSAKENNILKGTLQLEKNGDIAVIVPNDSEESLGIDNKAIIYKL